MTAAGRPGAARATALAAVVLASWSVLPALAQTSDRLVLERSDAVIELVNEGRSDQGARTVLGIPGCVPGEEVRSSVFYAPGGGVVARITQNEGGDETIVRSPLMTVLRYEGGAGAAETADQVGRPGGGEAEGAEADGADRSETLEAVDAAATFADRPPCLQSVEPAEDASVVLEQGRTTVVGERFFLDRDSDVATMDGPVSLVRASEGDGPTVEADAEGLRFDLGSDRSTLSGGVRVRAGERVSEADELELDEAAGVAILRGSPAVSREGGDEVRGARLLYDLDTNDVVVEGGVSASFELDDAAAPVEPEPTEPEPEPIDREGAEPEREPAGGAP